MDISEADKHPQMAGYYFGKLTADRVTFSVGRDLVLNPRQTAEPLNFFVYPHLEVDKKKISSDQISLKFRFAAVKQDSLPAE